MNVFMAGHTKIGLLSDPSLFFERKSQHLTRRVRVLSHSPLLILASVLAESGATRSTCAHFLS